VSCPAGAAVAAKLAAGAVGVVVDAALVAGEAGTVAAVTDSGAALVAGAAAAVEKPDGP
jgi:hypothetical protein